MRPALCSSHKKVLSSLLLKRDLSKSSAFRASEGLASKPASSSSRSKPHSDELYANPSSWVGLSSDKIFQLYEERVLKLGSKYTKCEEELRALLSTSKDTGVSAAEITKIYNLRSSSKNVAHADELIANKMSGISLFSDPSLIPFQYDEYSTTAQDLIEQHRRTRNYNRIAAYELPLLSKFRQEYKPSKPSNVLKVRYTNYIGEEHPSEKKVVIKANFDEFSKEMKLNEQQQHKLKLILGARYDLIRNEIHMSCEKFKYPTQNYKYLLVLLQKILKEVKEVKREGIEDYTDLPLDTRIYARKLKHLAKKQKINAFPEEWLRPQDAPVQKNDLNSILESLKQRDQK